MYIAEGLFDALKKEPLQMFLAETLNRNTPCEHHGHVCLTSSSPLGQFFYLKNISRFPSLFFIARCAPQSHPTVRPDGHWLKPLWLLDAHFMVMKTIKQSH